MWSLRAYWRLLTLLTLSGLLLMFCYVPSAAPVVQAASATQSVTVGYMLRGVHFWAAQVIVLVLFVYLARVVFVRTNHSQIGWAIALTLLTLALCFTGYLLPWDRLGFWMQHWFRGLSAYHGLLGVYWLHSLVLPVLMLPLLIGYVRRQRTT